MADTQFDLIVIGGGPAGYVGAIRAAQLGMSVACVDKRAALGGTCLNVGCIPSKALLQSSEKFAEARDELGAHGVMTGDVRLDLGAMLARKDKIVGGLNKGISYLFEKNRVKHIHGGGRVTGPGEVAVEVDSGAAAVRTVTAARILIATGSESMMLPGVEIDERRIVSSTGALSLAEVPAHLVVIGGGYIGLELGSVWRRLGAAVTVVEFLDRIVPGMDGDIATHLQRVLVKQGFEFRLGTKVTRAAANGANVTLEVEPAAGGAAETLECDVVLVAIGRRPNTDGLGLDELGVGRDNRGFIEVDGKFQTGVTGIFAVGDVIPGPMLAHKAEDEAVAAVEIMAGQAGHIDYDTIPAVIFTHPEAASVGRTEAELKDAGIEYNIGKFPFSANARTHVTGGGDGFVKILACARTDRVLGAHIIGPDAGTLIAELALAMEFSASAEDIARTCHAHPTLNEAVKEAALAASGRAIHI
jgi:dihydrolipoamide dehydrogenase